MRNASWWCRLILVLVGAEALAVGAIATPARAIALAGQAAPGFPDGTSFAAFTECQINNAGQVAFITELADAQGQISSLTGRAIYLSSGSALQLVAAAGQQAPGTPEGVKLALLMNLMLNERGQVAFVGVLQGPGVVFGTNQVGIWVGEPGRVQLVARSGDAAPGTDGLPYRIGLDRFVLNREGGVAFAAGLSLADEGIWAGTPGAIQLVARTGKPAPAPGTNIQSLDWPEQPVLNDLGEIAFAALLGVDSPESAVVFSGVPSALASVAWPGDSTPTDGLEWGNTLGTPSLNNADEVLLDTLVQNSTGASPFETLWLVSPFSTRLLASEGADAPETGLLFKDFNAAAALGSSGNAAFVGHLQDPSGLSNPAKDTAVFLSTAAGLRLLAWKGAPAAGLPPNVVFGDPTRPSAFPGLFLNERGQVAFTSTVSGPGVSAGNNTALWASDTGGTLRLLIRQGDSLDLGNGLAPTISTLVFGPNLSGGPEDGRASPFNSLGQYSLVVIWNGSGGTPAGSAVVVLNVSSRLYLNAPQRVGNNLQLSFATEAGKTYILQSADSAQTLQWNDLTQVTGTDETVSVSDPNAALLPRRFYRVRQLD
jgi:hypothetical protein